MAGSCCRRAGKQLYLLGAEQWAWIGEDLATGLSRTTISRCAFRRRPCHAIVFRRQHPPNPPRLGAAPLSGFIARLEDVVRPGYPALNSAAAPNLRSCIGQEKVAPNMDDMANSVTEPQLHDTGLAGDKDLPVPPAPPVVDVQANVAAGEQGPAGWNSAEPRDTACQGQSRSTMREGV